MGALLVSINVQTLRNRGRLFEMIDSFSDFNRFGKPKMNHFFEKNLQILFKSIRYGGYLSAHLVANSIVLDDNCGAFKNTKYCSALPYYVPFDMKPWELMLITLFLLHAIILTINTLLYKILLLYYSLELVIVRIEHLNEIIVKVNLTRNEKNNFNILRNIALYQQHIFKLFQLAYDFFTSLLVPTKILIAACLSISFTDFFLRKNTTSFLIIIFNLSLFLIHAIGQRFTTASNKIAEAIYNLNWYEADASTRKFILFLLSISQKELKMELPLFGALSNRAAANEFNKIYIFFNWMSKVTTKRNFLI
ncbi:odorant receptor 85c-like [Onthophagus taurus]|uniref:odorant receptor 85c-like n=1 Tax=Onthophagus taurus TaxID=166361 RepID=UPI0039BEA2AF